MSVNQKYLEDSEKTLSTQDSEQRTIKPEHFENSLQIVDAGLLCDFTKRTIFYKDGKANERLEKNQAILFALVQRLMQSPTQLSQEDTDLFHAALGVGSEAGEVMQEFITSLVEWRPVDKVNMKEEVGDILWYLAIICRRLGFSFDEAMEANIAKLAARYPEKFNCDAAVNRDLENERRVLETPKSEPTIWQNEYSWESLNDITEDIFYTDVIPDGEFEGTVKVTVEYIKNSD